MFFTAIHQMMTESVDLTIVIRKTNGQLTVSTLPKSNGLKDEAQNHIVPLTVTGTPQELDTGFLQAIARPIQKTCGLLSNMAQFEAQAEKAAASSKAAKEAKSKETKEEREKREKYEKLMKKANELMATKNFREAVSMLTQAKACADTAQLKEIEEKIKAADTEMNKGSLFGLMEQEAQPEPAPQPEQSVPQQPAYTQPPVTEQRKPQVQRPQQPAYNRAPQPPAPGQARPAPQRPQQTYTQHPQQPGIWPQQQAPQPGQPLPPQAQYLKRTTGQQPPQPQYPPQPEIRDWQEERFMQEEEQQQAYLDDPESPTYSEKDYEEYVDFPQSMLEPKYSPYHTV